MITEPYNPSQIVYGDYLYTVYDQFCLNEDGLTYAVKAGPEFEIVERNSLNELCMSCPAVAGNKLLIRTASKLYCMTEGAKLDSAVAAKMGFCAKLSA